MSAKAVSLRIHPLYLFRYAPSGVGLPRHRAREKDAALFKGRLRGPLLIEYTNVMQVFISHSSKDRSAAQQLAHQLSQAGLRVWIPNDEILPGDNWAKKIGQALEESDLMVVLVTPHAFESEWLKEQIQFALTSGHYKGRLIPVFLGQKSETPPDMPWILSKLNPVRIEGRHEDWQQVVDKVLTLAK